MSGEAFVVTGADEVARRFGSLSRDVDDLHGTYSGIAAQIATDGRGLAPKRTGRLVSGIRPSSTARAGGVTLAGVPYAGVIHFGWPHRNIAASLFLSRAADTKASSSADRIGGDVQRRIDSNGLG